MKIQGNSNQPTSQQHDWVGFVIEIVWRSGRCVLETSLFCILGVIVFSQLGTLAGLMGAITSLGVNKMPEFIPAAGWTVGLLVGLSRLVPCLKKPFGVPIDDSGPNSCQLSSTDAGKPRVGLAAKATQVVRSGAIGGLLGLVAGFFLSLFLIIVCTAGILSPIAPRSWRDGFRIEAIANQNDVRMSQRIGHDEGTGTGAKFWHPVFGSILKWTIPSSMLAVSVFCIVAESGRHDLLRHW